MLRGTRVSVSSVYAHFVCFVATMGRCAGRSPRGFIVVSRAFVFRHPGEGRYPVRTNVSTCVADSKFLSRATRVPNPLRGKSSLSLGLGPARPRDDDYLEFFYNINKVYYFS